MSLPFRYEYEGDTNRWQALLRKFYYQYVMANGVSSQSNHPVYTPKYFFDLLVGEFCDQVMIELGMSIPTKQEVKQNGRQYVFYIDRKIIDIAAILTTFFTEMDIAENDPNSKYSMSDIVDRYAKIFTDLFN